MSARSVTAAIALGSNLGDRRDHLARALREIAALHGVRVLAVSRLVETEPVGGPPGQARYLNGAILVATTLDPRELLGALLEIERQHGRERSSGVKNAARTLDLDLLVHADHVVDEEGLTLPHPRLAERAFVLEPLCEIAPDLVVPGIDRTVLELARALAGTQHGTASR